jgi:hypothetical protein
MKAHADAVADVNCDITSGIEIDIVVLCELCGYHSSYKFLIRKQSDDVARRRVVPREKVYA